MTIGDLVFVISESKNGRIVEKVNNQFIVKIYYKNLNGYQEFYYKTCDEKNLILSKQNVVYR